MTEYTDNYGLNKYSDGDAANLRDQYNASMDIIDAQLKTANDNAAYAKPILDATGLTNTTTAGESKTRWDAAASQAATNKNNIAEINANLNALHANTVPNAQALYNRINALDYNVHNVMVIFGDSQSAGYGLTTPGTDRYTKILADKLGMIEKNYAVSGAGFTQGSKPFIQNQVVNAKNDDSFTNDNVGLVIIEGGANDEDHSNIRTIVNNMLQDVSQTFPNAKIIVLPVVIGNRWHEVNAATKREIATSIIDACNNSRNAKTIVFEDVLSWFQMSTSLVQSDGLHLSESGHALLARRIYSSLNGATFSGINYPHDIIDLKHLLKETTDVTASPETFIIYKIAPNLAQVIGLCTFSVKEGASCIGERVFRYDVALPDTIFGIFKPFVNNIAEVATNSRHTVSGTLYVTNSAITFPNINTMRFNVITSKEEGYSANDTISVSTGIMVIPTIGY